ncbi:MAG: UDP-N-acetylglucosamine 2-epimerase (non-hydrolyzing) [Thiohalocapsa sp.]
MQGWDAHPELLRQVSGLDRGTTGENRSQPISGKLMLRRHGAGDCTLRRSLRRLNTALEGTSSATRTVFDYSGSIPYEPRATGVFQPDAAIMKIATIIGARPQFIKAAVVSRALREHRADACEVLIHTGQHFDANMSDVFFDELEIPRPDHHLGIGGGTHGQNTGRMIEAIETVLLGERPDWVLVYGDTDSTLAGTLAAVKLNVPVAHVEAGLRSFNRHMPEEINRVLTDHAADLLFTPTETAVVNLRAEGVADARIRPVGDVMYDAALFYAEKAEAHSDVLARLSLRRGEYILATVHRAENTDDAGRLSAIMRGLMQVARARPVVLPLHPRTRVALKRVALMDQIATALTVTEPLGYLDMLMLERHAAGSRCDRFRWGAKRGLFLPGALRDLAGRD